MIRQSVWSYGGGKRLDEVNFRFGLNQMFDGCSDMCWT